MGDEGDGGFVGVEVVLGSIVVSSTGKEKGKGQLLHHFGDMGDATVLVGGKGKGGSLGYGLANVGKEIGVHWHGRTRYVVHPCGTQEDGIRKEVENTLFGLEFVACVVVLRIQGGILRKRTALGGAIVDLVAGEEDELGSRHPGCLCQMHGGEGVDEITLLGVLLTVACVGYGRYVQEYIGPMHGKVCCHGIGIGNIKFAMTGGKDFILALPAMQKTAAYESTASSHQYFLHVCALS